MTTCTLEQPVLNILARTLERLLANVDCQMINISPQHGCVTGRLGLRGSNPIPTCAVCTIHVQYVLYMYSQCGVISRYSAFSLVLRYDSQMFHRVVAVIHGLGFNAEGMHVTLPPTLQSSFLLSEQVSKKLDGYSTDAYALEKSRIVARGSE